MAFQGLLRVATVLMGFFLFELANLQMLMNDDGKNFYYNVKQPYIKGLSF